MVRCPLYLRVYQSLAGLKKHMETCDVIRAAITGEGA